MKYFSFIFISILLLGIHSCKKTSASSENGTPNNISIQWLGNTSDGIVQYERIYGNDGGIIALRFHAQFEVLEGSGEITITMTLVEDGQDIAEQNISENVNPEERYDVSATVNFGGTGTKSCGYGEIACKLIFSSTFVSTSRENTVLNWVNNLGQPYCVDVSTITEVSIDAIF